MRKSWELLTLCVWVVKSYFVGSDTVVSLFAGEDEKNGVSYLIQVLWQVWIILCKQPIKVPLRDLCWGYTPACPIELRWLAFNTFQFCINKSLICVELLGGLCKNKYSKVRGWVRGAEGIEREHFTSEGIFFLVDCTRVKHGSYFDIKSVGWTERTSVCRKTFLGFEGIKRGSSWWFLLGVPREGLLFDGCKEQQ